MGPWSLRAVDAHGTAGSTPDSRNQPFGKQAQWEPHGPFGNSPFSPLAEPRDGAATIESNFVNFSLPHVGHSGCRAPLTSISD